MSGSFFKRHKALCYKRLILGGCFIWPFVAPAHRLVLSLDGPWQITDSKSATEIPTSFLRAVPVPGLAHLAVPGFANVDDFYSREHLANRIRAGLAPQEWLTNFWVGKVNQERNYFWYRKTFHAPKQSEVALLKINKAQFGTAVWLNEQKLGEYAGCFSASYFHLENVIHWDAENTLLVRVGAHPAVLPDNYPTGSDFEKIKWTPGIYDSVTAVFCENPLIETVQVGPRLAAGDIVVQTHIRNCRATPSTSALNHNVTTWKGSKAVAKSVPQVLELAPGEEKTVTQRIPIPGAHLWSPEDPFLYVVETSTGGGWRANSLWHARIPFRRSHPAGVSEREDLLSSRFKYHVAPVLRRSIVQRLALA